MAGQGQQKKGQQNKQEIKVKTRSRRNPGKTLANKARRKARHPSCLRPPKQAIRSNPTAQTDSAGRNCLVYPDGYRVYPLPDDGKSPLRAIFGGQPGGKQDWNRDRRGNLLVSNRLPA